MFALPYVVLFEVLGPIVELSGYVVGPLGMFVGVVDWKLAVLFLAVSVVYGTLLSMFSVIFEQITVRRYPGVRDLVILLLAGLVENLGFRQRLMTCRTVALIDLLRGKQAKAQPIKRKGFDESGSPATESA